MSPTSISGWYHFGYKLQISKYSTLQMKHHILELESEI